MCVWPLNVTSHSIQQFQLISHSMSIKCFSFSGREMYKTHFFLGVAIKRQSGTLKYYSHTFLAQLQSHPIYRYIYILSFRISFRNEEGGEMPGMSLGNRPILQYHRGIQVHSPLSITFLISSFHRFPPLRFSSCIGCIYSGTRSKTLIGLHRGFPTLAHRDDKVENGLFFLKKKDHKKKKKIKSMKKKSPTTD